MKTTKRKCFDAVAESRRWKEAVSQQTARMTPEELLAYFDKTAALATLRRGTRESSVVREETPEL